jgi:hypothetical protein
MVKRRWNISRTDNAYSLTLGDVPPKRRDISEVRAIARQKNTVFIPRHHIHRM